MGRDWIEVNFALVKGRRRMREGIDGTSYA
jgi:hypothetical protein